MLSNSMDFFEGLRTLPRDVNGLRHHLSRVNYTLQKRYHIPAETAELALDPQSAEEFDRYYRQQVTRIVGHFNAMTRKQLKVRVDPRLPRGMRIMRGGAAAAQGKGGKTEKDRPDCSPAGIFSHAVKRNSLVEQCREAEGMDANSKISQLQAEGQQTPQATSSALAAMMHGHSATVSSDDRSTVMQSLTKKSGGEVLFGTPPEFKGFTVPMEASPTDSFMSKSPLLF